MSGGNNRAHEMPYNARMPRAIPSYSLRAMLLLVIVLTQLLSPLLHGHLGTPKQTGLHVHPALSGAVDSHSLALRSPHDASLSPGAETTGRHVAMLNKEPLEVDVDPALRPLDLAAFLFAAAAPGVSALTFLLLAALACAALWRPAYRPVPALARWRDRINRPQPAQGPPLLS
ncbi:hypothetical protein [Ralstonia condita]|nr:hypothetical protein [Ralstonia sp. LMG 7141]